MSFYLLGQFYQPELNLASDMLILAEGKKGWMGWEGGRKSSSDTRVGLGNINHANRLIAWLSVQSQADAIHLIGSLHRRHCVCPTFTQC